MSKVRGVLDTNVILASRRSQHPLSPGHEVLDRCRAGEWTLLYSPDIFAEYASKLFEMGTGRETVVEFIALLTALGEAVDIEFFHLRHYPADMDDTAFVLCAWNGAASHLVSYDRHLLDLAGIYTDVFEICRPLRMLEAIRAALPA